MILRIFGWQVAVRLGGICGLAIREVLARSDILVADGLLRVPGCLLDDLLDTPVCDFRSLLLFTQGRKFGSQVEIALVAGLWVEVLVRSRVGVYVFVVSRTRG